MSFATLLPMAFVMIAGPQILSAIFLATSDSWKRNSLAFVVGAGLSITAVVTAAFLLGVGATSAGASHRALYVAALVLLLAAMVHTYLGRAESAPPAWMGRVQAATARQSLLLGAFLLGLFPTDLLTSMAVGSSLAAHESSWWNALPFIGLTLALLSSPAVLLLAFGQRAEAFLPRARDWMTANAWVVNEVVLAFFVIIVAGNLGE